MVARRRQCSKSGTENGARVSVPGGNGMRSLLRSRGKAAAKTHLVSVRTVVLPGSAGGHTVASGAVYRQCAEDLTFATRRRRIQSSRQGQPSASPACDRRSHAAPRLSGSPCHHAPPHDRPERPPGWRAHHRGRGWPLVVAPAACTRDRRAMAYPAPLSGTVVTVRLLQSRPAISRHPVPQQRLGGRSPGGGGRPSARRYRRGSTPGVDRLVRHDRSRTRGIVGSDARRKGGQRAGTGSAVGRVAAGTPASRRGRRELVAACKPGARRSRRVR